MLLVSIGLFWVLAWWALICVLDPTTLGVSTRDASGTDVSGFDRAQVGINQGPEMNGAPEMDDASEGGASENRWLLFPWQSDSLSTEPGKLAPIDLEQIAGSEPVGSRSAGSLAPKFYAACSGAGTVHVFETSGELVRFIADKSLSSWAVFKRRYARWWAVWRRVDLSGRMSSSEIQGAIWET